MSTESFTTCERLLSATANGIYQGVLVAALTGLALRIFTRTNAATRHAIWFGVLLFVTALIPAHLLLSFRPRPEILAATTPPASSMMAVDVAPPCDGTTALPPLATVLPLDSQPDECDAASIEVALRAPVGEIISGGGLAAEATEKAGSRFLRAILKPFSWNLETAIHLPHSICLCLVCAWVLLASVRGGLIAKRIGEVRRLKTASKAPSRELLALFDRLRRSLASGRNVLLRISGTHRSAVVLGFIHPVVLLPTEMDQEANEGEVEQVLRHELAHVDRRDDWGNLAQQVIEAALFFHPAVWWISARISLEREIACDDRVLDASGSPRAYALTLANVASRMSHCRLLLAPGVSNNNSQLQQRITMILNTNRDISPRLARSRLGFFTTATALLAVLAINAGPRLVLAQSTPETAVTTGAASAAPSSFSTTSVPDEPAAALPPDEPGTESGPRYKPGTIHAEIHTDYAPGGSVSLSAPAAPPLPAMPALAPVAAAGPVPPAPPPARPRHKNMSIEERLDRLERALEDVEARDGGKIRHRSSDSDLFAMVAGSGGQGMNHTLSAESKEDMELKRAADEMKRAVEQARREVEAGQREAEAGQRDAEQAMRDIAKLKIKDYERSQQKYGEMESEAPLKELQALRDARQSLERQLQNISRQIKRLEQDHDRMMKEGHGQPEDGGKGPKPANPALEKSN